MFNQNVLIQKLEKSLFRKNPILAEKLQPGIPTELILKKLQRAKIKGLTQPIVEMYSWRNGTILDIDLAASQIGFFPKSVFQFININTAIVDMKGFKEVASYHPRLASVVGRYFPFLWDGSTGWFALDLSETKNKGVVMIQFEDDKPLRRAYPTFEQFIEDVIRANDEDDYLTCFGMF